MRESFGSVALYNIIIVFIVVTFAILAGTMSYSKAFKVNNRIINAIEKYEGYNESAADEIDKQLISIGYQFRGVQRGCPNSRRGVPLYNINENKFNEQYEFCIYKDYVDTSEWSGRYVQYGVVSYIYIDFPVVGDFLRIPVYGKTRKIFEFLSSNAPSINDKIYKISANYASTWTTNVEQTGYEYPYFETSPDENTIRNGIEVYKISNNSKEILLNYNITKSESKSDEIYGGYKKCNIYISANGVIGKAQLSYLVKSGDC